MSRSAKWREEFIARLSRDRDALPLETLRRLLRHAATLQRLAEAQCNGDWPYENGTPERLTVTCPGCEGSWVPSSFARRPGKVFALLSQQGTAIPETALTADELGAGDPDALARQLAPADAKLPLVWRDVTRNDAINPKVCPDCRTAAHVEALLARTPWRPIFGGDPRGCVLKIARRLSREYPAPSLPHIYRDAPTTDEDIQNGRAESRGDVIRVPAPPSTRTCMDYRSTRCQCATS